ncbi:diacylglyceryl transferase [Thermosipho sp. 1063]|uniref:prolipoprotein diacylglyceryl transferase n=1 Tax=unclassified Thermosipho (in: thermotogales) TaxID=2676525 RepID=UPI0009494343|nr:MULTISPECIES: prolipoprotein diacylglyceryl transferase [unclassified Thermosipho (in: thermotogales)]ANQ54313.1 diacylglyceryl transferase [Thermosipho sp. 1070]APT72758.1 diacylglyceryl transferase [Thermosipho sp. 1063]OOC42147.1 diacylglyceryl transferase [Thermosipho sp. 1074]
MKKFLIFIVSVLVVIFLFWFLSNVFSGKILLKRYIFKIGMFELRWYSFLIVLGIVISYYLVKRRLGIFGIEPEHFDEAVFWGIIFSIIGARVYYVIFMWDEFYSKYPDEIVKIWHGGLAIHGAIIGAILSTYIYTKVKKNCSFSFLQGTDLLTSVLPLGQALGRWGNFFNYEAYGGPTNLPWKMYVPPSSRMPGFEKFSYFHPTFLYESIIDFLIFLFLYNYDLKKKKHGETTALYFILYSINRFWIESLRTDSLYFGKIRVAQLVSLLLIVFGIFMFIYIRKHSEVVK